MDTTIALKETLKTAEIAKITGCSVNEVRYRMRHNIWTFGVVRKTGVLCLLRTIFLETTYASCSGSTPASISNFVFLRIFGAFKASPSLSPTLPMKR